MNFLLYKSHTYQIINNTDYSSPVQSKIHVFLFLFTLMHFSLKMIALDIHKINCFIVCLIQKLIEVNFKDEIFSL